MSIEHCDIITDTCTKVALSLRNQVLAHESITIVTPNKVLFEAATEAWQTLMDGCQVCGGDCLGKPDAKSIDFAISLTDDDFPNGMNANYKNLKSRRQEP